MLDDVTFVKQNDVEGIRAAVNDQTCAIVLEPIFGEGGIAGIARWNSYRRAAPPRTSIKSL